MSDDSRDRDDDAPIDVFATESAKVKAKAPRGRTQNDRTRASDATEVLERDSLDFYAPPSQLEVPQSQEYVYRWVAEFVNGQHMPRNVQMRLREGYTRVMISELPEDFLVDEDRGDQVARTGGLMLMRMHWRKHRARTNYYRKQSIDRLASANELQGVAGNDSVMEDRGTRTLMGADAGRALAQMARS